MRKFKVRKVLIAAAACVIALGVSATADYPMKVKDARGKMVTVRSKPLRIVSLAPSNTEILYALGLARRIVGVTDYCNYPRDAAKKPKVGDARTSVEKVASLKPDLVLAHAFVNDDAIPRLERLGITVYAVDPKTLADVVGDIRAIGKITARPKTAESVAKGVKAAIASVKSSRAKKSSRKVLVVIQSNPLWAAGPKTFVDEMLKTANAKNIAFDCRPGFNTFSKELALKRNPDVIIAGTKDDADYFLASPLWRHTKAVKNKRVYVIDPDTLVRPGPRLGGGLKELASKLNY